MSERQIIFNTLASAKRRKTFRETNQRVAHKMHLASVQELQDVSTDLSDLISASEEYKSAIEGIVAQIAEFKSQYSGIDYSRISDAHTSVAASLTEFSDNAFELGIDPNVIPVYAEVSQNADSLLKISQEVFDLESDLPFN
jgi:hypothetical protein